MFYSFPLFHSFPYHFSFTTFTLLIIFATIKCTIYMTNTFLWCNQRLTSKLIIKIVILSNYHHCFSVLIFVIKLFHFYDFHIHLLTYFCLSIQLSSIFSCFSSSFHFQLGSSPKFTHLHLFIWFCLIFLHLVWQLEFYLLKPTPFNFLRM